MLPLDGVHVLFDDATEPPLESISNRKNALRHGSNPLPHQAPQDFFAALTQHRFLMLFLFFVSYADCLSIHRRPQYTVLRLPGSECFDHCSQCLFRRVNLHTIPDRFDFIYYSFGMMTQLGATGIAAVTDQARSISRIEAIPGQLYLAVLISRLVGGIPVHSTGG
jgi:hypothetical protein